MGRFVSLAVLMLLLAVLGAMFYQLMAPFLLPMFLAAITAIVAQPLQQWIQRKLGDRRALAAGITSGVLVSGVLLPTLLIVILAASQLTSLVKHVFPEKGAGPRPDLRKQMEPLLAEAASWVPDYSAADLERDLVTAINQTAQRLSANTFNIASSTVGAVAAMLVGLAVFLVALYYFLADGPELFRSIRQLIPVAHEQQLRMADEFTKVTRAVVTATFLAAAVQGLMTAGALQVLGFGHFMVFLVISTIAAMIPMVGAWMVWFPCVIVLAADQHYGAAIGLALFGWLGISLADNVVRMYVLNSDAELHPLLALVSVLGALDVMGLWGIFIGPIVAACFTAGLRIVNQELQIIIEERKQRLASASAATATAAPTVVPRTDPL